MARAKAETAPEIRFDAEFPIVNITANKELQARASMNLETVSDYADLLFEGTGELPPIDLIEDDGTFWLTDGWHRLAAYKKLGMLTIPANIKSGSKSDAIRAALAANRTHGLRRSNADKRRAVAIAFELMAEEKANWTDVDIADLCGVSSMFVGNVRKEMAPDTATGTRTTADGRTVTTGNTGRRPTVVELKPLETETESDGDSEPTPELPKPTNITPLETLPKANAGKAGAVGIGLDGLISKTNALEVSVASFMGIFPNAYLMAEALGANPATATTYGKIRAKVSALLAELMTIELPYEVSVDANPLASGPVSPEESKDKTRVEAAARRDAKRATRKAEAEATLKAAGSKLRSKPMAEAEA